jgi:hypothetical protein
LNSSPVKLDESTEEQLFRLANHVSKYGRNIMRGPDDRRMRVAGIDLDIIVICEYNAAVFQAGDGEPKPAKFFHTLLAPDWKATWVAYQQDRSTTAHGYDNFLRDLTFIMLSGEIDA